MKNLTSLKTKGQESFNRLIDVGRQQPENVRLWSVTAVAAVVGGLAVAATAKGVLAIVGTLAAPPVALTVGALAGGALGWSFMQPQTDQAAQTILVESETLTA